MSTESPNNKETFASLKLVINHTLSSRNIEVTSWQLVRGRLIPITACNIGHQIGELFPIKFVTLESEEIKGVFWIRADNQSGLGSVNFAFPQLPIWWPKEEFVLTLNNNFKHFQLDGFGKIDFMPEHFPNGVNFGGTRDIVSPLILCNSGGVIGDLKNFGALAAFGMGNLETYQSDGETWLNILNERSLAFNVEVQPERNFEIANTKVTTPLVSPSPNIPEPTLHILSPIYCGEKKHFSDGDGFTRTDVFLGEQTGTVFLDYMAFSTNRFIVVYDGEIVIDTGYRGNSNWNDSLNNKGFPSVSGGMRGSDSFEKTTSSQTASVFVHSPINFARWEFAVSCPGHMSSVRFSVDLLQSDYVIREVKQGVCFNKQYIRPGITPILVGDHWGNNVRVWKCPIPTNIDEVHSISIAFTGRTMGTNYGLELVGLVFGYEDLTDVNKVLDFKGFVPKPKAENNNLFLSREYADYLKNYPLAEVQIDSESITHRFIVDQQIDEVVSLSDLSMYMYNVNRHNYTAISIEPLQEFILILDEPLTAKNLYLYVAEGGIAGEEFSVYVNPVPKNSVFPPIKPGTNTRYFNL